MPLGDWTRVSAGTFHAFHNAWITELQRALNSGVLPPDFYALGEQWAGDIGPGVLTLHRNPPAPSPPENNGGAHTRAIAVTERPPQARITQQAADDAIHYLAKRRSLIIRHASGDRVVALIEVVSPGNKQSRTFLQQLLDKVLAAIAQGCHVLIADLLPPGTLDPNGLHDLIWQGVTGEAFVLPGAGLRTIASYRASAPPTAYVEFAEIGDELPAMAMFLSSEEYVNVPLEETYQAAFATMPAHLRDVIHS